MSAVQASPAQMASRPRPPRLDFPLSHSQPAGIFETHHRHNNSNVLVAWFQTVFSGLFQLQVTLKREYIGSSTEKMLGRSCFRRGWIQGALCDPVYSSYGVSRRAAVRGKVAPRSLSITHLLQLSKHYSLHSSHSLFSVP